jgi:two-component system phosphate regulon sensor histidine kinase PhoR
MWPALALIFFAAAIALHFWWRRRLDRVQSSSRQELDELRRKQELAANQFKVQQDALFDSMAEGLLVLDETGRIELANRAFGELFRLNTNIRSRTILEALRSHELAEIVDLLGTEKQVLERELKLPGPEDRWLQVNGASLFNGDGRRHGTILVFHDLTRLKRLENARQEFVGNVSHELRTPLSLIKGYVETLLDGAKDNPEVAAKFLLTIERNAERLKLLIEDLLTISELESGRVKLNLQEVRLHSTADKVLEDLKSKAGSRNVSLLNQTPDVEVRADPVRLEQVLGNLVDNAIKYGRPNGTVTIGAREPESSRVEVSVQDDGPGIPPEALERVFERFYRVDKARWREQGGTGLGLSIVKHIVQTHGGKVWATSEVGQGTTFYFTLPSDSSAVQQPLL